MHYTSNFHRNIETFNQPPPNIFFFHFPHIHLHPNKKSFPVPLFPSHPFLLPFPPSLATKDVPSILFIIIIRNIAMGCGAVCGADSPSSSKLSQYSQAKMLELFPKLTISKPFLSQPAYQKFSQVLRESQNKYIIKVGERVGPDEEIEAQLMDKWRTILYGLDKSQETYKKCLSFQVRTRKQEVTNTENVITNSSITQNKSYHELKPNMQYHQCFTQIEKDLNRTFEFKQEKKKTFENILKRISNYFPSMGYTQGVNFVVGYLLIIGYSESDTFWMFAHLATHERYLVLGLYQDGFPLAYIYTSIFKRMLKRLDARLHDHLYETLMLDQSMWIFKWFITYYIYSFPFNTIKYVWNLVIELGGIALVYYALALVMHLREKMLKIGDPCDMSEFLQELRELNRFNELVRMKEIVQKVYEMKMKQTDLEGISELKPSFYKTYYESIVLASDGRDSRTKIDAWYEKLMKERRQFQQTSDDKNKLTTLPQLLRNEYLDLQKSINILQQRILKNQSNKMSKSQRNLVTEYFGELINEEPIKIQLRDQQQDQLEIDVQYRSRNITKMSYDMQEEINQAENQSDSNSSQAEDVSYHYHQPRVATETLDIQSGIFNDLKKDNPIKEEINLGLKVNTIVGQIDPRKRAAKQASLKANNIKLGNQEKRTGLALAAQNILCNLSVTNSQYSSNSSKNASYRPKKHKENNIFRYNRNGKVRTQDVSQQSMDPSSSRQSSLDHHTDKQSFSGMTHREDPKQQSIIENINQDRRSSQDFMVNSHCPQKLDNINPPKELTSEIQLFNGDGLFKKKKKVYNRNSNIISINQNITKSHKMEEVECYSKRTVIQRTNGLEYPEEESIDAILYALSTRKPSQPQQQQNVIDSMLYEIQSVK